MTPSEYELLLHDAEVKLARLKALYEQYFQGIERLEPQVPRKEVDRVMELLRKQQPRNTALRFRTQMLIAKYGTYQTYWQRIARQIEEGTFRRDVVRAQQRRHRERARPQERENEGPSAWELDVDVELDAEPSAAPQSAPSGRAPSGGAPSFDDSDIDAILGSLGGRPSEPVPARRVLSPFAMGGPRSVPPRPAASTTSPAPVPTAAPTPTPVPAATPGPSAAGASTAGAPPSTGKPVTTFGKPGTATFARPGAAPRPVAPAPVAPAVPPAVAPPRPPAAAAVAPPGPPAPSAVAVPRPPAPAAISPHRPASPAAPPRPPVPAPARPAGAAPPPPRPAAPPAPAAPSPPAARPAAPAAPAGAARPPAQPAPDDARMRKIYETYVEARRRNNERVDNVKYETVAQSVQQLIPKLREKHGNRPIDFEVVVQNGKVGLKPKVGG